MSTYQRTGKRIFFFTVFFMAVLLFAGKGMRFIGHTLLSAYPNRIINLHPAYLPEFPGAHSIADAYEAKVAQTGVTVHFVDEGVDTGPIIRQERVAIDPSWDLETLESHVHAMEYDLFWQVIEQVAKSIEEEK